MKKKHKKLGEKTLKIKDDISGYDKDIIIKTFRLPNGIIENFFINDNKSSVQIFPITDGGRVITVRQFRPGREAMSLELPGGGLEDGENPADAALRELSEETGYKGELSYLGKQAYSPYCTGEKYMFVASNCKKISNELDLDENEFLRVIVWPMHVFRNMIRTGRVRGIDCVFLGLIYLGLIDFKI